MKNNLPNLALALLRIGTSLLLLTHGIPKIEKLFADTVSFPDPLGVGATASLILVLLAEVVAPVFIIIGYRTKVATLFPIIMMTVALLMVHFNDPIGKKEIKDMLQKLRDGGKTIILNSHLLSEVEVLADRVCILQSGKIAKIGTIEDLTSKKSQYEITAVIGHQMIDVPEEIGKRISISTNSLIVELVKDEKLNDLIGLLLMKRVQIKAVNPLKVSLEQSFYDTVTHSGESN